MRKQQERKSLKEYQRIYNAQKQVIMASKLWTAGERFDRHDGHKYLRPHFPDIDGQVSTMVLDKMVRDQKLDCVIEKNKKWYSVPPVKLLRMAWNKHSLKGLTQPAISV